MKNKVFLLLAGMVFASACRNEEVLIQSETSANYFNGTSYFDVGVDSSQQLAFYIYKSVFLLNEITSEDYCEMSHFFNDTSLTIQQRITGLKNISPQVNEYVSLIEELQSFGSNFNFEALSNDSVSLNLITNYVIDYFDLDSLIGIQNQSCDQYNNGVRYAALSLTGCTLAAAGGCILTGPSYFFCFGMANQLCIMNYLIEMNKLADQYPNCHGGVIAPNNLGMPLESQSGLTGITVNDWIKEAVVSHESFSFEVLCN